jgi:hypothetical protein
MPFDTIKKLGRGTPKSSSHFIFQKKEKKTNDPILFLV